jgi:dihydropteroate synthase
LKNREIQLGDRTLIMGVINASPDSFSDGGRFNDPDRAFARAIELEEAGADIIDVGAESTRPDSERISEETELHRLIPVLKRMRDKLSIPISVDTYKAGVAKAALEYGAEIINDPSGFTLDAHIAKTVAQFDAGFILNHMRGTPDMWAKQSPMKNVVSTIASDLAATISRVRQEGMDKSRIVIDPGIGFGKRKEENSEILGGLPRLADLDFPILVGPSRKSFLKQETEDETEFASAAAVAACILGGAHIVRVHDVKAMRAAVQVADAVVERAVSDTLTFRLTGRVVHRDADAARKALPSRARLPILPIDAMEELKAALASLGVHVARD